MKEKVCAICGKPYQGFGCNAMPVANGQCCDKCDNLIVLPTRLAAATGQPVEHFLDWAKEMFAMSKFYKSIHKPQQNGNGQ
jgi:hypothetical protein